MKIMAVDYGDARTGLAVCDRTEFLASPVGQIEEKSMAKVAEKIIYASREFDVGMIVIGLPRNMDGTEGPRAELYRTFAGRVEEATGLKPVLWDERRTTVDAHRILGEQGVRAKNRKDKIDSVAATLILEGYLDWKRLQAQRQEREEETP